MQAKLTFSHDVSLLTLSRSLYRSYISYRPRMLVICFPKCRARALVYATGSICITGIKRRSSSHFYLTDVVRKVKHVYGTVYPNFTISVLQPLTVKTISARSVLSSRLIPSVLALSNRASTEEQNFVTCSYPDLTFNVFPSTGTCMLFGRDFTDMQSAFYRAYCQFCARTRRS